MLVTRMVLRNAFQQNEFFLSSWRVALDFTGSILSRRDPVLHFRGLRGIMGMDKGQDENTGGQSKDGK